MKKLLVITGIILLAFAVACENPFFPDAPGKGRGSKVITFTIDEQADIDEILQAIQDALDDGKDVIINGTFPDVDKTIVINIPEGSEIKWEADITGNVDGEPLIVIEGDGNLVVTGNITNEGDGPAIYIDGGNVTVEEGAVIENTGGGTAIVVEDGELIVNDGTIKAEDAPAIIVNGDSEVIINDGIIENNSDTHYTIELNDDSKLTIIGGTIRNKGASKKVIRANDTTEVHLLGDDFEIEDSSIHGSDGAKGYYRNYYKKDKFDDSTFDSEDYLFYIGNKVVYTIRLDITGLATGDSLTLVKDKGYEGEEIILNYNLGDDSGKFYNSLRLVFGEKDTSDEYITTVGTSSVSYEINPNDAYNNVIEIIATFTHSDKPLQPEFAFTLGNQHKTLDDPAFTNTASGGAGTGAVTYSSGNTAVVTVNTSSGLVTIAGSGKTLITATKAECASYAEATATYEVTVALPPADLIITISGTDITLEFMNIPATTTPFMLTPISGTASGPITLSAFKMSKYQVTQEQYLTVMGTNPSYFHGGTGREPATDEEQGKRPVEWVTWYDAVEFCNKLSDLEGLDPVYTITSRTPASGYPITNATVTPNWSANGYRLPTEAQWEYACRAGTTGGYNTGWEEDGATVTAPGWYYGNSNSRTHQVGLKAANAWGLYDMHGNVWEWCYDSWDGSSSYGTGAQTDPIGASGTYRVRRGGSWRSYETGMHSGNRSYDTPSGRLNDGGFRLVRP